MPLRAAQQARHLQYIRHLAHTTPKIIVYLSIPGALIIAFGVGYALKRLFHRYRKRATTPFGELLFAVFEQLPIPLLLLAAVYTLMEVLTLPKAYEKAGSDVIFTLVVAVIFYFLTKGVVGFMHRLSLRDPKLERVTQPASFITRLIFIILALIIILDNLGVHLTAVWTTLGIGSVAVALGLQETLSNAFAGLYIMADQPVSPGDYVKLDMGQEGYVVRIGWRATSLRTLANNVIFVPNAGLAKAVITNYSRPEDRMGFGVQVSVAYGTDPNHVERVLLEIAREAARDGVEGLLAHPEPSVRFIPGFGPSSLDFSLNVQVRRFVDQYLVQSELRKRIVERFQKEGIEMPFPTRTLVLDKSVLDSLGPRAANQGRENGSE